MNGDPMAFGKKVCPVKIDNVDGESPAVIVAGRPCSIVPIGLYPRKAAKSAPEAGVLANTGASCGAPELVTAAESAAGNDAFNDMIMIEKNIAWLMVCPQFWIVALIPEAAPL